MKESGKAELAVLSQPATGCPMGATLAARPLERQVGQLQQPRLHLDKQIELPGKDTLQLSTQALSSEMHRAVFS